MLETERAFFDAHREEFLATYRGAALLIRGEEVVGAFSNENDAYAEGVRRFGNVPFLVRRVDPNPTDPELPALSLGLINADL